METQDTQIHAAMDAKELAAKITQDKLDGFIDFMSKVVVPLLVAQQKQTAPVGPEAEQIAGETSPGA
jgi:hypothetical protein